MVRKDWLRVFAFVNTVMSPCDSSLISKLFSKSAYKVTYIVTYRFIYVGN
ncbi:hypothetical protein NVIE_2193 [Nitrososphaera viennensis EN76]|uniref:Uncharacterized protein n=1 Tax=Nitrososphaera viennensis EN76 TaxID=926571 RepID=A0A060HTJ0_9ARCH|nr:hypothetical protein NVIE_2193 [Nitrososphaera viennensis EN76]